jgi:hypothetical protein
MDQSRLVHNLMLSLRFFFSLNLPGLRSLSMYALIISSVLPESRGGRFGISHHVSDGITKVAPEAWGPAPAGHVLARQISGKTFSLFGSARKSDHSLLLTSAPSHK